MQSIAAAFDSYCLISQISFGKYQIRYFRTYWSSTLCIKSYIVSVKKIDKMVAIYKCRLYLRSAKVGDEHVAHLPILNTCDRVRTPSADLSANLDNISYK